MSGSISGNGAAASPQSTVRVAAQQRAAVAQLSPTDRHVRAHEMAHLTVAGTYAIGGPSYTFTIGPDGQMYATGGDVQMDAAPDPSDPKKTIEKARVIEAAANAPADPSSQDRRVAAMAAQMEQTAQRQVQQEQEDRTDDPSSSYGQQDDVSTGQIVSEIL
jgi:hypothetical protein